MIAPADVRLFMGCGESKVVPRHAKGHVDAGAYEPQYEGPRRGLRLPNVLPQADCRDEFLFQEQIADRAVKEYNRRTRKPQRREHGQCDLQALRARPSAGHFGQRRIHGGVENIDPGVDRGFSGQYSRGDGFRAGEQTPRALHRHRQYQPDPHGDP